MSREAFRSLVGWAIRSLPERFLERLENIEVVVEDEPSPEDLRMAGVEPPHTLLGLYSGVPLAERGSFYGNVLPDRITLYQRPIQALCRNQRELKAKILEVLMHEIGHHFGFTDEELEEIEA